MSEFIEFLSPSALSEMEKANAELVKMVANVKSVQVEMAKINTPSGGDASVKQLTAQYQQQEKAIQALQAQVQKLTEAKQKQSQVSVQEKVVASQQLKIDKEAALAVSALTGAYQKLTLQRKQAATNLQNLIASEKASTAEIRKAQKEYDILTAKVAKADQAIGKMSMGNSLKGLTSQVSNLVGAFGISTGAYLFASIAKDIYQTTKQLQSMDLALKMVSGTQQEFSSNQVFLTNLAEQYGIEIKGLTKNFTEFWVASKGKLEAEQIKAIFTSISKSVAVMGLSVEQQDSAFLALQQMMSKGTVQAEELKKQLGNALPGAVKAATMAYQALHPELKVTEKLFMEQMKAGKILSSELLPELAKQFEKLYGIENVNRAETLQAAQERLSNSWTELIRRSTSGASMFTSFLNSFMSSLSWWLDNAETIIKYTGIIQYSIASIYEAINKGEADIQKHKENKDKAVKQALNDIEQLSAGEKKLALQIKVKNDELERNEKLRATANNVDDSSKLDFRINKNKEEIQALEAKLKAEELLNEPKRIIRRNEAVEKANTLLSESNSLELKNIQLKERQKELQDKTDEGLDAKGNNSRAQIIKTIGLEITKNNASITKNNVLMTYYNTLITNLGENTKKAIDSSETKLTAAEIKKQAQDAEKLLKDKYDLEISNIKRKIELTKDEYDVVHAMQKDELGYFEGGVAKKMMLSMKLATFELELAQRVANEKKRLAKGNVALGNAPTIGGDTVAQNEYNTEAENVAKSHVQRMDTINKDYFKAMEDAIPKDWSSKTPTMWTAEQIKQAEDDQAKIAAIQKKIVDDFKSYIEGFSSDFASTAGFSKTYEFFIKVDEFGKTMWENLDAQGLSAREKFAATFLAISESAQEMFNFISQASQENFDAEYERLEKQKNISLAFAGESASAKSEIEQQYEQRRKQIARREAKAKKEQAIFNIGIDTAQAIIATLAKTPPPAGLALAAAVAAIGAIQISMVASQKIPQYWTGTDNAEGGLAWTQERGREIITDSQGRIKSTGSDKGAELTMLSKGDKVFNAEKSAMMFDNSLNSMLLNNGIVMPKIEVSMDTQILGSKLDKLSDTIASKESFSITRDAKGERIYQRNQNERKELLNNILNVRTYGV